MSYQDLKIKSRKLGNFKSPPPQRRDRMLRAINHGENCQNNRDNDQYVLSYNKPDLCNDYISMEQGSADRFSINFPRYCVLGHVLLDTNLLDEMDSWRELTRPTNKPRSVDPCKSKSRQTLKNNNKQQENTSEE